MHTHISHSMCMEVNNLRELDLSFYPVSSRCQTQVIRFGGNHPYLLNLCLAVKYYFLLATIFTFIKSVITTCRRQFYLYLFSRD